MSGKNKQKVLPRNKSALCISLFSDGSVHKIPINHIMKITRSISDPYVEYEYKISVLKDYLELVDHSEIRLGEDASRALTTNNAGGASEYSEAMSIHYFENVFDAKDFVLENDVKYWQDYKMVDYICTIKDQKIGVSVTRAMGYPCSFSFNKKDAKILLDKKIHGLVVSCDLVITKHSFNKSILHIWCQNERIASLMKKVYREELKLDSMDLKVLCDVIVILTICNDKNIYTNRILWKNKILNIK